MSFRAIIAKWPSMADLARDVGTTQGVVQAWSLRDSIPPQWWAPLLEAASARKLEDVTRAALDQTVAARRPPRTHKSDAPVRAGA